MINSQANKKPRDTQKIAENIHNFVGDNTEQANSEFYN